MEDNGFCDENSHPISASLSRHTHTHTHTLVDDVSQSIDKTVVSSD